MSIFVFEFNDAGIGISKDGDLLLQSPGYAVLDGDQLYLGSEAQDIARIRPRWTNNQFWSALGTSPMQGATPRVRHHADLAFAHLEHIWKQVGEPDAEVILAVPGSWTTEQLGVLLGLTDEVGIQVRCMVDAAVAAAAGHASESPRHLDISLHRILLSEISGSEVLARQRVLVLAEEGLVHFNNLWANTIADQFVHATRFDPMHSAVTEQQLHDQLPGCLAELDEHGSTHASINEAGKHYSVTLRRDQLVAAAAATYPRIVQQLQTETAASGHLLLSERFAGFPGLEEALSVLAGLQVHSLEPGAAARGCMACLDNLPPNSGDVHFYTELRRSGAANVGESAPRRAQPTHLMYRGQAWALGSRPTVLSLDENAVVPGDDRGQPQCSVQRIDGRIWLEPRPVTRIEINGRDVGDRVALSVGDQLRFGDHEEAVQVISLVS